MNVSPRFLLRIPEPLFQEMIAQAEQERPLECCGLLAGKRGPNGIAEVTHRYALRNELASPIEFLSDPASMFAAHKDMRAEGGRYLGRLSFASGERSDTEQTRSGAELQHGGDEFDYWVG